MENSLNENLMDGKIVVADTSSLLVSGINLLEDLNNCQLVIPAVVVQELENNRNHNTVGFIAREWLRFLEQMRVQYGTQLSSGVPVDDSKNLQIRIEPNHSNQSVLPTHLRDGSHDSTILSVAKNLANETEKEVIVLSNDVPMRLHATLDLSLDSTEYSSTEVEGVVPFSGIYNVTVSNSEYSEILDKIIDRDWIEAKMKLEAQNARVIVSLESGEQVEDLIVRGDRVNRIGRKQKAFGMVGRTIEQDIAMTYLKEPPESLPVVSLGGGAGTGKTLMSVAVGLEELKQHHYQKMIIFRSLHELGQGQEMGFLPGGIDDKMDPWAGAIWDALDVLASFRKPLKKNAGPGAVNDQLEEAKRLRTMVEISPITYLRGRSLSNSYIVLEEAQNFSKSEILNILSRVGEGTKIVLTFDSNQVDSRFLQAGDKADIWTVIDKLKGEEIFAHMTLKKTERSKVAEIASKILENGIK